MEFVSGLSVTLYFDILIYFSLLLSLKKTFHGAKSDFFFFFRQNLSDCQTDILPFTLILLE